MIDKLLRRTLLCVEDDEAERARLREGLADFDLEFARNAFEAIRAWNRRGFDAYVLEYFLPDWTGPSLCREIRKSDPHAPVIFYTDAGTDRDRARALRAGASAFLSKPETDASFLAGRIRSLLTVSDAANVQARLEEERAVSEEISRRIDAAAESVERARVLQNSAVERSVRARAMAAFFAERGTKAYFDRSWPQLIGSVRANAKAKV